MVAFYLRWLTPAALGAMAFAAAAQTPPSAARKPDPLDANASVPAVAYESAFSRYRRAADDPAIPWRESNATAARIGGWRAYAREAQQAEPAPSATATRPAQPDPKAMPMPRPMPQAPGGHETP
jgi:hypothetical protein